jgi:hypothetical protein
MPYRTGNHWGVTIVGERGPQPCDETGPHYCLAMGENSEHPGAELVAVVTNGDTALAERICALLNGEQEAPVPCREETWSWDHFTPEQVDSYPIRCTLQGPHDEHEDEHTGLTWRSESRP